ncbi:ABC-2 transporter permease [Clostridium estertheticum]|uniref:ABC-2 transporter permease n=1 Tax=Clostridium estertheticum TaxID=238834 RepID=UPI001C6E6ABC|nr:ABC-2 transporter permease [Clostridium estertheticum]MBW9173622.1 ABC-2 transporter permease [Clostridium estertheticum]WLC74198.1 ABC-2 transporter permease [Clostridium estertheticum]
MFNLIMKDIRIQKKDKTVFMFFLLNMVNTFIFQTNYATTILLCFLSIYLLAVYANAYDFKYNSELMINSLPVNRKVVVAAKYLSVFLFLICAIVITLIVGSLFHFVAPNLVSKTIGINTIFLEFFIVCIYFSIFFPFYYKLGYLRSRWVNFIIMAVLSSLISFANEILKNNTTFGVDFGLLQRILLTAIPIIFIVVSFFISIKIYINKEL